MIPFSATQIIIPRFKIEEHITGGFKAFSQYFPSHVSDDYLAAIAVENATGVRMAFEILLKLGLRFNNASESSDDFVVAAKEGLWWPAPWLIAHPKGYWFIADVDAPV
jgi:hypothetical protein